MIWFRRTVVITEGGISIIPLVMAAVIVYIACKYGREIVTAAINILIVVAIIIGCVMGLFGGLIMARGAYLVDKKYRIHRRIIRTVKGQFQKPINSDNAHIIEPTPILNRQEYIDNALDDIPYPRYTQRTDTDQEA